MRIPLKLTARARFNQFSNATDVSLELRQMKGAAWLLLMTMVACSDFFVPDDPARSYLDPNSLRVGDVIYACGGWTDDKPEDERATVDVFFTEGERSDGPADKSLDAVASLGGTIVHAFNRHVARVDIPTEAIPTLVDGVVANHVRNVPDLDRHDLPVIVLYTRPVQETDIGRIRELGGEVVRRFTTLNYLTVHLPDQSIPTLLALPAVGSLEPDNVLCTSI